MLLPREWEGKRTIRYVEPGRRREAEDSAGHRLPRATRRAPVTRTGGQILVDQLRVHGADTVFCVPGESYIAALDALGGARDEIRLIIVSPGGGRGKHGRGVRQAHRAARRLLRDPRAGSDQRVDRRAHGLPGLDAAPAPDGPGGARLARARGVPGGGRRPHLRRADEVGGRDRRRRRGSRSSWPVRSRQRPRAVPGRWRSRCPRTCSPRRASPPTLPRTAPCRRIRARRTWPACRSCSPRRSVRSRSSVVVAGPSRPRPTSGRSRRRTACRPAPRFAARTTSTTARSATSGMSAWRSTRRSRGG